MLTEGEGAGGTGAHVMSVNLSAVHSFSKEPLLEVRLLAGLGVEGDAHCGPTVRHRYDRRRDPERPNLRQVHLIGVELFDDLATEGHVLRPGDLGENITTAGLRLMDLPRGTRLHLGDQAVVELTGLRTPCRLIDTLGTGLMDRMWVGDTSGGRRARAGVMGVVVTSGPVRPGDAVTAVPPAGPPAPLTAV